MTRIFNLLGKSYRFARVLTAMLAIAMFTLPTTTMADETSDTEPKIGAWAKYSDYTLTFFYGEEPTDYTHFAVDTVSTNDPSWSSVLNVYSSKTWNNEVKIVEFEPSFINVHPVSTAKWFYYWRPLTTVRGLEYLNTEKVTTMKQMFFYCNAVTELDFSHLNTSNVEDMTSLFNQCYALKTVDLSNLNTSNVKTMLGMFYNCQALTELDLTSFNTSNVVNMSNMFCGCSALTTIYASDYFTTDKVVASSDMFNGCSNLQGHGTYDDSNRNYLTTDRANFTKQWGYLKTYYKVGDTKHEYYGIAPLTVDNLALEDGADFVNYSTFTATQATYTRSMPSTYGTLCLPFAIDTESTTGCSFYALDNVSTDKIELTLLTGTIEAGTPVLVYSAKKNIDIAASNVAVIKTPAEGTKAGEWQLKGTFTQTSVPDDSYIISNNKFWLASELKSATTGSTVKSKGLRAWLTDSSDGGNKAKALSISTGETTSIDVIDALSNGKAEIYDIQGRRIDSLQKGMNIVKTGSATKKIIVK